MLLFFFIINNINYPSQYTLYKTKRCGMITNVSQLSTRDQMTYKLTNKGHYTAFNNGENPNSIPSPEMTNVKQFKREQLVKIMEECVSGKLLTGL